jgi:hypothetical protein
MTSTRTVSIGKVGFSWQNAYDATRAYVKWDCVLYRNSVYMCIQDASAGSIDDPAYFVCINRGLYYAGTYDSSETYNENDIVLQNDLAYVCKESGVTGAFDSSKWFRLPSFVRNISFGIGNRYTATEADNDITALWNLIDGSVNSVNGSQTEYGMTELSAGTPIVSLTDDAPVMDCPATYNANTSQPYARLPSMNIPGLLMTNGDAITVSVLKWCGSSSSTSGMVYLTPGSAAASTLLADGECGLQIEDRGAYIYVYLLKRSSSSVSSYTLLSTNSNNNYFRVNNLNDITITLERTASGYETSLFINGSLIKSQTATANYDIDCGKVYLGLLTSNAQQSYFQDRGLAQIAVYSGKKYSANYTADCLLLKKTVI